MNVYDRLQGMGWQARCAQQELMALSGKKKNKILEAMAAALDDHAEGILAANRQDMEEARAVELSRARLDRLELTPERMAWITRNINTVVSLKDPVGAHISHWIRPNGLDIQKIRTPIGVIAMLYESRPVITAEAAALCVKSANALILRGGKEALRSNREIVKALNQGAVAEGLPEYAVQFVNLPDRDAVKYLVQMTNTIDLAVCRGGPDLMRTITELARVPVIKHSSGACHTYVDVDADLDMALTLCENAKCSGNCNSLETLLIHGHIAPVFLPRLHERLAAKGVELRGDNRAREITPEIKEARDDDWSAECLDLIMSVAVVDDVSRAIAHINRYGSRHSDAIISSSDKAIRLFSRDVDSAVVYVNASPRFSDGTSFGMGADIGISTDKLHARGPMGLEELTTYKYVIKGQGQIRE